MVTQENPQDKEQDSINIDEDSRTIKQIYIFADNTEIIKELIKHYSIN